MVDITAQRVQDEAIHELSESLRRVFHASPLGIIVLEPDATVRHWNPACERIFGWPAAEVVGEHVPYLPPGKQEEFADIVERTLAGESLSGFETTRSARTDPRST
jgi:PAS domain S-box-containing protein